tara:strand:- start:1371 stop:1646 length:276 start_codon:yes stop_codon:yes gene_type:complete
MFGIIFLYIIILIDGQIANLLFFISGTVVGLWSLSVDIKTLVIGISGLLVSFAFMIGSSASKYLEVRSKVVYIKHPNKLESMEKNYHTLHY